MVSLWFWYGSDWFLSSALGGSVVFLWFAHWVVCVSCGFAMIVVDFNLLPSPDPSFLMIFLWFCMVSLCFYNSLNWFYRLPSPELQYSYSFPIDSYVVCVVLQCLWLIQIVFPRRMCRFLMVSHGFAMCSHGFVMFLIVLWCHTALYVSNIPDSRKVYSDAPLCVWFPL